MIRCFGAGFLGMLLYHIEAVPHRLGASGCSVLRFLDFASDVFVIVEYVERNIEIRGPNSQGNPGLRPGTIVKCRHINRHNYL